MNYLKSSLIIILLCSVCAACNKDTAECETPVENSHINYFGFTIIDTYWDDPTDNDGKTNYADEVNTFCNMADILVVFPTDDINERVQYLNDLEMKAVLHLNELFFEFVDTNSESGANYDLRSDYQERWNQFKEINQGILNSTKIASFYIGEEPTWNGISFAEMDELAEFLKVEYPQIPLMIIEAYPSLDDWQIPEAVDWVGFDRYFIKDPTTDTAFQADWELLKSKMFPSQKIMVIMDSHYISWAHGDFGGISLDEMGDVANNYYDLAKGEERVIGILGYFWPNGFDFLEAIGARGMPSNVQAQYETIGKEISGK